MHAKCESVNGCMVNCCRMVGQWLANGWRMVGEWLANGWPTVGQSPTLTNPTPLRSRENKQNKRCGIFDVVAICTQGQLRKGTVHAYLQMTVKVT